MQLFFFQLLTFTFQSIFTFKGKHSSALLVLVPMPEGYVRKVINSETYAMLNM